MNILAHLNPRQQEAVQHIDGPLLIVAGAGSGKTRALTHRIAYMIEQGILPWQILAVTFTNKAAKEILHRAQILIEGRNAGTEVSGDFGEHRPPPSPPYQGGTKQLPDHGHFSFYLRQNSSFRNPSAGI